MRGQVAHPEQIAVELADKQHGVVERRQLLDRGITPRVIDRLLRSGLLHPVHRGVYAVGRRKLTGTGRCLAAVFALGEGTALSHHSAADHLGLRNSASPRVAVTLPAKTGRSRRPGITIHHCAIEPWETEVVDAIPTTILARTLMDLAEVFPGRVVEKALDRAESLRLYDGAQIDRVIAAHPGRVGAKRLRRILATHPISGGGSADEGIEELFLAIVDDCGFPRPVNKPDIWVPGRVVAYQPDFFWPHLNLIVETDGRRTHRTAQAYEDDRAKAAELTVARHAVLRFTYRQVTLRRDWVAEQLRRAGLQPL